MGHAWREFFVAIGKPDRPAPRVRSENGRVSRRTTSVPAPGGLDHAHRAAVVVLAELESTPPTLIERGAVPAVRGEIDELDDRLVAGLDRRAELDEAVLGHAVVELRGGTGLPDRVGQRQAGAEREDKECSDSERDGGPHVLPSLGMSRGLRNGFFVGYQTTRNFQNVNSVTGWIYQTQNRPRAALCDFVGGSEE